MGAGMNIVKAIGLLVLAAISVAGTGCVSTVGESPQMTAVVGNANTDPRALALAKRKAIEQRQELIRQPAAVRAFGAGDVSVAGGESLLDPNESLELGFADLVSREASGTASPAAVRPVVGQQVPYLATAGLPALPGVRLLGVISGADGETRWMVKNKDHVAEIVNIGMQVQVADVQYVVQGLGADSLVVKSVDGKQFLVRR